MPRFVRRFLSANVETFADASNQRRFHPCEPHFPFHPSRSSPWHSPSVAKTLPARTARPNPLTHPSLPPSISISSSAAPAATLAAAQETSAKESPKVPVLQVKGVGKGAGDLVILHPTDATGFIRTTKLRKLCTTGSFAAPTINPLPTG